MMQLQTKTQILDKETVSRKIKRMALEVAEQNIGEELVVIAGISGNGEVIAKCLAKELQGIGAFPIQVITVSLNKKDPDEVTVTPKTDFTNKTILLADDVANTGKTLFYALQPFFAAAPKKIQTAVLVERSHKLFPIQTDYAGLSIATTLQEHIEVMVEGEVIIGAWLY